MIQRIFCFLGLHVWHDGARFKSWKCRCFACGITRNHDWEGCKCTICDETRDELHKWGTCKCVICDKLSLEGHKWLQGLCSKCGEEHSFHEPSEEGTCFICGAYKCSSCKGYGQEDCTCKMAGGGGFIVFTKNCTYCDGRGALPCESCRGRGYKIRRN